MYYSINVQLTLDDLEQKNNYEIEIAKIVVSESYNLILVHCVLPFRVQNEIKFIVRLKKL